MTTNISLVTSGNIAVYDLHGFNLQGPFTGKLKVRFGEECTPLFVDRVRTLSRKEFPGL